MRTLGACLIWVDTWKASLTTAADSFLGGCLIYAHFSFFVSFGWVCFRDWVFDDLTIAIAENRRFSPVWKSGERSRLDGYLRAAFGEFSHVFSRELFPAVRVEVTRPPPFRKLVVRVSKVKDVID